MTQKVPWVPVRASGLSGVVGSLCLFIVGAHCSDETISRLIEAGENLPPGGRKLSLFGEALERGVVKGNDVVNQAFEEPSLVVSRVN